MSKRKVTRKEWKARHKELSMILKQSDHAHRETDARLKEARQEVEKWNEYHLTWVQEINQEKLQARQQVAELTCELTAAKARIGRLQAIMNVGADIAGRPLNLFEDGRWLPDKV